MFILFFLCFWYLIIVEKYMKIKMIIYFRCIYWFVCFVICNELLFLYFYRVFFYVYLDIDYSIIIRLLNW